jgi:PAS domain S-box-containing protein
MESDGNEPAPDEGPDAAGDDPTHVGPDGSQSTDRSDTLEEVLEALTALERTITRSVVYIDVISSRSAAIRRELTGGAEYSEIAAADAAPLVPDLVTAMVSALVEAGDRLRQAETQALYAEGLTMEKVARLLATNRSQVSTRLRALADDGDQRGPGRRGRRTPALSLTDPELRILADSIPLFAFVAAGDGSTGYVNRRGTEYAGRNPGTSRSWHWMSLVHRDDAQATRERWVEATTHDTEFDVVCRLRRADGTFRWHRIQALPIRNREGQVERWIGTAVDIDEQRQAEALVREMQVASAETSGLLGALESETSVALALVDHQLRVKRLNQRMAAINGSPIARQIGRPVDKVLAVLGPRLVIELRQVFASGESTVGLTLPGGPGTDGRRGRTWNVDLQPVRVGNDTLGVVIVVERNEPRTGG